LKHFRKFVLILALSLPFCIEAHAYSVLTHEQLIDLTWQDSIVPLLLSRYPGLTPAQLDEARAYAYGGCVIQDIGYYPFGDVAYSDLTHYVRSGDFIVNLLRDAQNADELAFAIGALSHYIGDSVGHADATNLAVPVEFPKLRAKYGSVVNYAEGQHQHVQTEFAFDINEIAHHRMAPVHYLRHIGLAVPLKQLALAFYQTYGLNEDFTNRRGRRVNVTAYRFAVRSFIPRIAYAVTLLKRRHEPAAADTPEAIQFQQEIDRIAAENNWDAYRRKAGIGTWMLAGMLYILPKFGPIKMTDVKGPTEATDAAYVHSLLLSAVELRRSLSRFTPPSANHPAVAGVKLSGGQTGAAHSTALNAEPQEPVDPLHPLPNRDLDTGRVVQPGGYSLTDSTYAHLLHLLTRKPSEPIPPGIKLDIQAYYSNPDSPITTKKKPQEWAQVQADLITLGTMPTSAQPPNLPTYGDDSKTPQEKTKSQSE
jgi:hypothetical protein